MLLKTYIEDCYASDISFESDDPENINRNWIAHGRYKTKEMTKVDCLKLFSALYAMINVVRFCKYVLSKSENCAGSRREWSRHRSWRYRGDGGVARLCWCSFRSTSDATKRPSRSADRFRL